MHIALRRLVPALWFLFLLYFVGVYPAPALSSEPPIISGNTQMVAGEQQVLSITNYQTGTPYTWEILSGGGTLSNDTGEHVTYTAPDSNPDCKNNPTIRVTDSIGFYDEIRIAVNCYTVNSLTAYMVTGDYHYARWPYWCWYSCNCCGCVSGCTPGDPGCTIIALPRRTYDCNGIETWSDCPSCCCTSLGERQCGPSCGAAYESANTLYDMRDDYLKFLGCCPKALFPDPEPEPIAPKDTDNGKEPCKICPCDLDKAGNPISVFNGNNIEAEEDLRFASPGKGPFVFERYYNSRSEQNGPLGYGWTHTYHVQLDPGYVFDNQYYLKIIDETGRGVYFEESGSGHFTGAFKEKTRVELEAGIYVWYRLDNTRYAFNDQGKLIWIEDEKGNRKNLFYDIDNRVETVTDETSGRVLTFYYNPDNRLDHISGPVTDAVQDGIWVSFGYDGNQNLISATYADGSGYDYVYGDPNDVHNLTEKRNQMGHLLSLWAYDDQDRAVDNFTRDGKGVSINYVDETTAEVTDAYGITKIYTMETFDGRKRVTGIEGPSGCAGCGIDVKRVEYDSAMRIIEVEYTGGLIKQYKDFDSQNNAQTVITAVGTPDEKTATVTFHPEINEKLSQAEASILGAGNKITIFDYDDDGNAVPNENPTRLLHRKIEQGFTRDISGNVISYEHITAYTYNSKGQVLSMDGPEFGTQDTTFFTYDPTSGDLLTVTRPVVGATTYTDYDAAGQVGRVTDANGNALTYTYDGHGRMETLTHVANGSTTTVDFNMAGDLEALTLANGVTSSFIYGATYGRLTRITDPLGNYVYYSYDGQGNRIEQSLFNPINERLFWKRYDFQGTTHPGKLWKAINPDNTYTEYTYDASGNMAANTDAAGKTTAYDYDLLDRLTAATQPGSVVTTYAYDRQNNLTMVTDAENLATTYVYDDLKRLIQTTSPDTGITTYAYDASGNLTAKVDANSNSVTYTYDDLNRLTGILFPDPNQDITYTYDQGTNGMGRLTGMIDPSGSYTYTYDALGHLILEEKTIDGKSYTTGYTYDAAGILTSMSYPDGRTVTYALDSSGRVTEVTFTKDGETQILADNINYRPFGPIQGLNYGNGILLTQTYDALYQMTAMSAGSVQNLGYFLDPVGNITNITDHLDPAKSQSFGYDDLYRLTAATGIYGTMGYTYDKVGNRLTRTANGATDTYTYAQGTNRISQITGANPQSFALDAVGNTTGMGDKTFVYNQNNRLISASENSTTLGEYIYNGQGQRTVRIADSEQTIYLYDLNGNLMAEADPSGEIISEYVYLHGRLLAAVKADNTIEATVDMDPNTLNLNSSGKWITAFIELPEGYDVAAVDPATITLNHTVYADRANIGDHDQDGILDLMVKFDRSQVCDILAPGDAVEITVAGAGEGFRFVGTDIIRVISEGKRHRHQNTESDLSVFAFAAAYQHTGTLYFYHLDHLGTPQVMTDENGEVVWKADYQPFGTVDVIAGDVENPFRFPGQYYDNETGLHYNWHRYYDPSSGRYLRPDPLGFLGGDINLYAYVQNNPVSLIDPLGLLNILIGRGSSLVGVAGVEGSGGVVINPGIGESKADVGVFGSVGGGLGLNVSADKFVGYIKGDISNVSGTTINQNFIIGPLSITSIVDINTGEFLGGTIGLGPSATLIGASITGSFTETYTIRDLVRDIRGFFRNPFGDPCE